MPKGPKQRKSAKRKQQQQQQQQVAVDHKDTISITTMVDSLPQGNGHYAKNGDLMPHEEAEEDPVFATPVSSSHSTAQQLYFASYEEGGGTLEMADKKGKDELDQKQEQEEVFHEAQSVLPLGESLKNGSLATKVAKPQPQPVVDVIEAEEVVQENDNVGRRAEEDKSEPSLYAIGENNKNSGKLGAEEEHGASESIPLTECLENGALVADSEDPHPLLVVDVVEPEEVELVPENGKVGGRTVEQKSELKIVPSLEKEEQHAVDNTVAGEEHAASESNTLAETSENSKLVTKEEKLLPVVDAMVDEEVEFGSARLLVTVAKPEDASTNLVESEKGGESWEVEDQNNIREEKQAEELVVPGNILEETSATFVPTTPLCQREVKVVPVDDVDEAIEQLPHKNHEASSEPPAEVVAITPLEVRHAKWWNCCGLLDVFVESRR